MGDIGLDIFADRLKELRIENGLTQAQFVNDLGITASALSSYEKNLKNPSISVAKKIAEKYDVSIDWLCGLSNKRKSEKKITTYKDLFEYLLAFAECEGNIYVDTNNSFITNVAFVDTLVRVFFKECGKMLKLLNEGTIDQDVYNFWLEKYLNTPEFLQNLKERKMDFFQKILEEKKALDS